MQHLFHGIAKYLPDIYVHQIGQHAMHAKYLTSIHSDVHICATYEVTGINHVTRNTSHR